MKLIIALLLCLSALFSAWPHKSHAEEIKSSDSNVTVLPAKFDLTSRSGQVINQSLRITNDSDDEYLFALSVDNISLTGENGEVGIGDNGSKLSSLLSSWIKTNSASGKLEPHSSKIIDFTIDVPKDIEPGGKYASIVISLDKLVRNPGEPTAIAKVVSLILLTVSGDYQDRATLLSFDALNDGRNYAFVSRIRNQGIAHIKPRGSIIISNFFGKKIDEIPFEGDNVLPGSTRKTSVEWQTEKRLFGIYQATLIANYGQKNDGVITAVAKFNHFPFWPSLLLIILLLVLIIYGSWTLGTYLRRR